MKKKKGVILIIFTLIFGIIVFVVTNQIKTEVIETEIDDFQREYKNYIDNNDINDNDLDKYYKTLRDKTYRNFVEDMNNNIYDYNFLKEEKTTSFTPEDLERYQELIRNNDVLINSLENNYRVSELEELKNNINEMKTLARKYLKESIFVNKEYNKALKNEGTTIKYQDDCFSRQSFVQWQLEQELSKSYCNYLKIADCLIENNMVSYSLNNPVKVNKKLFRHEYVSYYGNDYRNDFKLSDELKTNYKIAIEVFSKKINQRKIYKYNIIVIPKDYKLGCDLPK